MKKGNPILFILLILPVLVLAQIKKPVVVSDLMKITTTNQIHISTDGTKAVISVLRKALKNESDYYYTRHLYLLDLFGKNEPTQLTYGDKNDNQPQLSPDGKQIVFVRIEGEKSQLYILPLTGGEAHVITRSEYGATNPRWSPDGKKILYNVSIPYTKIEGSIPWNYERPGRTKGDEPNFKTLKPEEKKNIIANPDGSLQEVRAWLAKNANERNPRVIIRTELQGELELQPEYAFPHLFLHTLGSDQKDIRLTHGFQDFEIANWSPDGKSIITHSKVYTLHPDREQDSDLWIIDPESLSAKEFLTMPGYRISNPAYSPDGSQIAFYATNIENRHAPQTQLGIVSSMGGKPSLLTSSFDRDIIGFKWSSDSKTIYFSSQTEGAIPFFGVPAKGGSVTKIFGSNMGVNSFDVMGDKVVYALTETKNPWEIYLYHLKDKTNRQLTQLNEGWAKDRAISTPKEYWLTRPDGTKIQYWVMEPMGKKEGVKYPVILNIHGGPAAMWGPGIFSMWHELQLESNWGYGLVYCNPRGSSGYGDKFKKGNFKDWSNGPSGDVLASLDEAIKQNNWMDKDQLFIEGGSYAGYLVAWIIAHDNRFKAANAQRGVYDLTTFMGEGNAWRLVPDHFGGYPWHKETKALLDAESPLTYVENINTPLLIIHADQDLRTGVIQSEMLFKSLKVLNKPVEYIRYSREGHELTRSGNPGRMMDHLLRVIEFFERYAKHPN